jgi:serine/threonine-protein kinase
MGALGPVFRAYDAQRERLVAVKLFRLDLSPERVRQLVAEFEQLIAAELIHPAMAVPVAAGMTGESAYLAQDYVVAESLAVAVEESGPAPPSDALRVAAQLAGALDFAAVVAISHGALHPRDVLLSSDGTRLTGIGVARALEAVGVSVPIRKPYSAPERIGGGVWDRRADVYSLAALMYELLCGRPLPGDGREAIERMKQLPGADPSRLPAAFARALAEDANDRFETALEFAEALKEAFPQVVIAPPSSATKGRVVSRPEAPRPRVAVEAEPRLPLNDAEPAIKREVPEELPVPLQIQQPEHPASASAPLALRPDPPASAAAKSEPTSVIEQSRSAVWPLFAALAIGLALGFSGGYAVASRDRQAGPSSPSVLSGRDTTDVAIGETAGTASGAATAQQPGTGAPQKAPAPATPPNGPGVPGAPAATVREGRVPPAAANPSARSLPPRGQEAPASQGNRQARNEPEVAGGLLVRSTPAGARVSVDGRNLGETPLAVRDLLPGGHRVRIQHDGYVAEDRRVTLTRNRPTQSMIVELRPLRTVPPASGRSARSAPASERFSGALAVESRPAGASVYLDDRLVGTTPLSVGAVSAGEHLVRLELDGYLRWTSSIRVVAAESNRVTASLEK